MTGLPTNPDVIIVGAGAAGLSAAKALIAAGLEVVVLEADGHIGGRCITDTEVFSTPFDRGGSWLHDASINPLARLAEAEGASLWPDPGHWRFVHKDGRALTPPEIADYAQYHETMWSRVKWPGAVDASTSIASTLPPSPWRDTAAHWVAQMHGGDADVVAAEDAAQYADGEGDWLVGGGLGAFVARLHAGVPVRLNCAVTSIDHTGPGVRVETANGTLTADRLILTVSTGVLAAETITFTPPLPNTKLAAIEDLPNGLLNKVGFEFDPAWQAANRDDILDYQRSGEEFCTIIFGFYDTGLAVGFTAGRFAAAVEAEGEGAATAFCREALRETFGSGVENHIRKTTETAWNSNPLTFGAYSYARPGGAGARAILAEPMHNKLFFAGEATMPDAYSTVHGAWRSGQETAAKILAGL